MKIVIDARLYGLENRGIGRYSMELVSALDKLDKLNDYHLLLRKKYFNKLKLGANIHQVEADFRHYSVEEQLKLPLILRAIAPDIFHALHTNVPLMYSGKLVVTAHDTTQLTFNKKSTALPLPFYAIKNFVYRDLFRLSVRKASAVIVPSEIVKADIVDKFSISPTNVRVVPEGVSKHFFSPIKTKGKTADYLLYVGSSYPHKNLESVIVAVGLCNVQNSRKLKFKLVVGDDIFAKRLAFFITKNSRSFVSLLEQVTDKELHGLYRNSTAFIFPSVSEGFGLPGLEAMASGTLVVCSDIPAFREVYQGNALYFDPRSEKSIAASITKAIEMNPHERKKRIHDAQEYVGKFTWEATAKKVIEVYTDVLSTVPPG